jgi:glutamate synthase domain-containing protein 1
MMSHNGEINTIHGNIAKMNAREGMMKSHIYKERASDLYPVVEPNMSDSASFDNTLEFLYHNGYSLPKAVCMMIPEAWQHNDNMNAQKKSMSPHEMGQCLILQIHSP